MSNDVIVSNEVLNLEEVKLPAITVCDRKIIERAGYLYKNESVHKDCDGYDFHKITNDFTKNIWCHDINTLDWIQNCNHTTLQSHPGCVIFNSQQTITKKVPGRHFKAQVAVMPTRGNKCASTIPMKWPHG